MYDLLIKLQNDINTITGLPVYIGGVETNFKFGQYKALSIQINDKAEETRSSDRSLVNRQPFEIVLFSDNANNDATNEATCESIVTFLHLLNKSYWTGLHQFSNLTYSRKGVLNGGKSDVYVISGELLYEKYI